jgi:glucose/arabinose dehydrogenase
MVELKIAAHHKELRQTLTCKYRQTKEIPFDKQGKCHQVYKSYKTGKINPDSIIIFCIIVFTKPFIMYKIYLVLLNLFMVLSFSLQSQTIELEEMASGFNQPVDIKNAGDDRLFIVEKTGQIWILTTGGVKLPTPFLNIVTLVNAGANERGLLGLAFHPEFETNGFFYVNYTGAGGHTRISRFSRSVADPNVADPGSELILMTVNQPFNNHNAGDLAFGPDGYLYIGMGDGGSAGDPGNRSQNPQELLGKMLRIDVDSAIPYGIPADNPFVGSLDTLSEIWALGLRNPWRISFDRLTGDFWIGDVGQNAWEEIDMEPAGSPGGLNWGWRCYEGFSPYNTGGCGPQNSYDPPVHVYPNNTNTGCSVTGGYVYRGSSYPDLYGKYIYADFCSGRIWALYPGSMPGSWENIELLKGATNQYACFGEDNQGELYVGALSQGKIYRIKSSCSLSATPSATAETCHGSCDGVLILEPSSGCAPYTLTLTRSDGTEILFSDTIATGLCTDAYDYVLMDCNGCIVEGSIVLDDVPPVEGSLTSVPETCNEACDGMLTVVPLNGCAPHTVLIESEGFTSTEFENLDLCSGTYSILLTDCNGCEGEAFVTLDDPDDPFTLIAIQDTLYTSPFYINYDWFLNGVLVQSTDTYFFVATQSGEWTVEGTNLNNCKYLSNPVTVTISSISEPGESNLHVFPNPFTHSINIQQEDALAQTIEFIDLFGRVVIPPVQIPSGKATITLPTGNLAPGQYFLMQRKEDGKFYTRRLVKAE